MPDGASSSELWLLRTYFGEDDDAIWTSLTESARSTRSVVPGAELVVSSDRTQCQQRIRRVVARLATRAEANDGLYVALADKQTFARPDRTLLTIDCSAVPRNAERIPSTRMTPDSAFRLGIDEHAPKLEPARLSKPKQATTFHHSEPLAADLADRVGEAVRASLRWRSDMTRDGFGG
ncbi:DUF6924 domain-containing protein [Rhodococcoides fascians]|uniref:DUF6924 domain-containing protein n=1 Tax=Nocardiaceae TaxID=85025 RepID=UPI0007110AB3|nr:hypothetical protein [Rhodococcus sp. Leaf233]KQU32917.1 hypothetical protein ASH04_12655 [Rhodococcus sp. Leaf233]